MVDLLTFIQEMTTRIVAIAWALFLLSWSVGWLLKGVPVPFPKLKRTGQDLIEDAVWAAFWLAVGGTIFALISYLVSSISLPMPAPPTP